MDRSTSRLVFTARLFPKFGMPPSFDRWTPPRRRFNQNIPSSVVLLQQCHCRNHHRSKLQNLSPPSVLFESSRIFYSTQETQMQKMMNQNFEIRILWFLRIFWNFRKGIARPIWTIMVAAKLDHSRVLVNKFRQNRSMLKVRSAGQRHTDRQTNLAENNGLSGLKSGQYMVCIADCCFSTRTWLLCQPLGKMLIKTGLYACNLYFLLTDKSCFVLICIFFSG